MIHKELIDDGQFYRTCVDILLFFLNKSLEFLCVPFEIFIQKERKRQKDSSVWQSHVKLMKCQNSDK